jgi:hypothetical protein
MRRLLIVALLALAGASPRPKTAKEIVAVAYDLSIYHRVSEADWSREVLPLIHETAAPRETALAVAAQLGGDERAIVLADALRDAPGDAALIRALDSSGDWTMDAAFGPVTFVRAPLIRAAWRGRPAAELAQAAALQISALGNLGRAADAVAVFDALPDAARTALLLRKDTDETFPHDVQIDLAVSAAIVGRADLARRFVGTSDTRRDIVLALITPAVDDPYDLLVHSMGGNGVWAEATAMLADRGGYPRFASVLRDAAGHATYLREIAAVALPLLPPTLRSELQATVERDRRDRAALRASARVASDNGILSLLRGAPRTAFEELPLPVDVDNADATAADCHTWKGPWPQYSLRRCEVRGNERLAIGESGDIDPRGGFQPGAWWLYHSTDGGATWEKVYTSVRERAPYEIVRSSRVPMLGEGGVRIEADVLDMDPHVLRGIPEKPLRRVLVAFSWADLRRDSDGDGLPDLVEDRLVTDPHKRDTDGDGIEDGSDSLPHTAAAQTASVEAQLVGMVLGRFSGGGTSFFIGDRSLVAASGVKVRMVVLTRDEADAYSAKFGVTAFGDLSFLIIRRDGKKATLYVNYATSGSTYQFEKKDGVWTMRDLGGWVS